LAGRHALPEQEASWATDLQYTQSVEIFGARDDHYFRDVRDTLAKIEEKEIAQWVLWIGLLVDQLSRHFSRQEGLPDLPGFMSRAQAQDERAARSLASQWLLAAMERPRQLKYWFDDFVTWWGDKRGRLFLLYDNIDLLWHESYENPSELVEALLSMWMDRPEYQHGRVIPKIFVREDTFQRAVRRLVDGAKLQSRSGLLQWDSESLYRLLIHKLADKDHTPKMSDWLRERGFVAEARSGRLVVMDRLVEGNPAEASEQLLQRANQAALGEWPIGRWMGKGVTSGYSARWIYHRICDFHGVATPRTMLNLFQEAAAAQLRSLPEDGGDPYAPLLSPDSIIEGFRRAADARVHELNAEYPVAEKLALLKGAALLIDREALLRRLAGHREGEEFTREMRAMAELDYRELEALGLFKEDKSGRVELPVLYRYGYGMKRAGAPKPRR
jgi:hypothetical protein